MWQACVWACLLVSVGLASAQSNYAQQADSTLEFDHDIPPTAEVDGKVVELGKKMNIIRLVLLYSP